MIYIRDCELRRYNAEVAAAFEKLLELNMFRGNIKEIARLETRKMFFDLITIKSN